MDEESIGRTVARAVALMVDFYKGSSHDTNHFLKVWAYARTIRVAEGIKGETALAAELAAVAHDIACPLCRAKYGSAGAKNQEAEGGPLALKFCQDLGVSRETAERVSSMVARHHTYTGVDGDDLQILLEADFLVNADEGAASESAVRSAAEKLFKTKTGKALLEKTALARPQALSDP